MLASISFTLSLGELGITYVKKNETMIAFFWDIFRFRNERNAIPFILLPIAE